VGDFFSSAGAKNPAPLLERPKILKVFAELFLKKRPAGGTRPPRLPDKSKFELQNTQFERK
jgi:hypothetical protein